MNVFDGQVQDGMSINYNYVTVHDSRVRVLAHRISLVLDGESVQNKRASVYQG